MSDLSTMKSKVRTALRTKLWLVSGIPGIGYRKMENVELDLSTLAGKTWVREFTRFQTLKPNLIGGGVQRYTQRGSYMVDLFFPKGMSTTDADTLEGKVLEAFAPASMLTASGISILITDSSASAQQDDNGGWYFRPLMIQWECYVVQ